MAHCFAYENCTSIVAGGQPKIPKHCTASNANNTAPTHFISPALGSTRPLTLIYPSHTLGVVDGGHVRTTKLVWTTPTTLGVTGGVPKVLGTFGGGP